MDIKEQLRRLRGRYDNPLLKLPIGAFTAVCPTENLAAKRRRFVDTDEARRQTVDASLPEPTPMTAQAVFRKDEILMGSTMFRYTDVPFTETDVRRLKAAGFDFVYAAQPETLRELCAAYDLPLLEDRGHAPDPALTDLSVFTPHIAKIGEDGWDEPSAAIFPEVGEFTRRYAEAFPERFFFHNLFPAGTPKKRLRAADYRTYVEAYVRKVPTDYISFDEYPFTSLRPLNKLSMDRCLETYRTVADVCRESGRDLRLYVQTQGGWFSRVYAVCSYAQIRWQVFAALCYGARSILQVNYDPVWGADAVGMIDETGEVTAQYLYAKRVNAEVHAVAPYLQPYRSTGVLFADTKTPNPHFGPALCRQREENRRQELRLPEAVENVRGETDALVGCFATPDGKKEALMLVCCGDLYRANASAAFTLTFRRAMRLHLVQSGKEQTIPVTGKTLTFRLQSGEAVFVEYADAEDGQDKKTSGRNEQ